MINALLWFQEALPPNNVTYERDALGGVCKMKIIYRFSKVVQLND